MGFGDVLQSIFLGVGLSMDAASVSMTDGMIERKMKIKKMLFIAILFGVFQGGMPLIGYFLGHIFTSFIAKFIPFIGFGLLSFLGIKMIVEGLKKDDEEKNTKTSFWGLVVQAIATSIDALTTGIIYADEEPYFAIIVFSIVIIVTFIICFFAIMIGKKFGEFFANYASIFGGIILFSIGVKVLSNLLPILFIIYIIVLAILLTVLTIVLSIKHKKHKEKLFNSLLKELENYTSNNEKEMEDKKVFINHLKEYKYKMFSRKNEKCHITSSAFVFNKNMDKVLFCYHKIYDSWSWLGGHADNEIDLKEVAKKEIKEETGLKNFELLNNEIVSLEILPVKKHIKNEKVVEEHLHFNITYAFISDENEELKINELENTDVKFISINNLDDLVSEKNMIVIYNKIIDKVNNKKIVTN